MLLYCTKTHSKDIHITFFYTKMTKNLLTKARTGYRSGYWDFYIQNNFTHFFLILPEKEASQLRLLSNLSHLISEDCKRHCYRLYSFNVRTCTHSVCSPLILSSVKALEWRTLCIRLWQFINSTFCQIKLFRNLFGCFSFTLCTVINYNHQQQQQ